MVKAKIQMADIMFKLKINPNLVEFSFGWKAMLTMSYNCHFCDFL